jgi:hypothetical protein
VIPKEHESETCHGRTTNVVIGIRDSHLQQLSCRLVVGCSCIGETDGIHATVPKDGVL